eukprot:EG_transcript_40885
MAKFIVLGTFGDILGMKTGRRVLDRTGVPNTGFRTEPESGKPVGGDTGSVLNPASQTPVYKFLGCDANASFCFALFRNYSIKSRNVVFMQNLDCIKGIQFFCRPRVK